MSTTLSPSTPIIGLTRRLPSLWACAGIFGLAIGALLLVLPGWLLDSLVWLAEAFLSDDNPLSESRVQTLHDGAQIWGRSGIIVSSVTIPLWFSRIRHRLMAWISGVPDRFFSPLPFSSDRYGLPFFAAMVTILAFSLATHWTLTVYEEIDWLEGEDGVSEWWSVATYLAAAGMAGATAWLLHGLRHRNLFWLQILLGVVFFLGAMEEMSWGQRLFGWGTPAVLIEVNVQREITLHNLSSGADTVYVMLFSGSVIALAGSALRAVWHHSGKVSSADFLLPSLVLAPALLMILIWRVGGYWNAANPVLLLMTYWNHAPQGSEVPEVLLGLCLSLYTLGNLKRAYALRRLRDTGITGDSNPLAVSTST